jgi:hypothetical protein
VLINSSGLLWHQHCWWWHLLSIQKNLALFQIMPRGAVNLAPLLYVIRTLKRSLFRLLRGLIITISMISSVLAIASVSCVYLTIILLP